MPLINGKSKKSFIKNLKTEMHEGKPMKQSLAIAYSMKRKAQKKAHGGMAGYPDGGEVKDTSLSKTASDFFSKMASPTPAPQSQDDKYEAIRQANATRAGHAKGGYVYEVKSPDELLHMQDEDNLVPNEVDFYLRPTQINKANVASNDSAKSEDSKGLNQHHVDMQASTSMEKEDMVDRIMNKKNKDLSSLDCLSEGGYVDDEDDMVNRIMHKRNEPFSGLDRYSEGGKVANDTEEGQEADKLPNQYDDLVLRDDLESSYGDDDNSGDALGNSQEDEGRKDIISRIMASRRKKDRLPNPA